MVNNVIGVVNYVIAARPSLRNFMIADTRHNQHGPHRALDAAAPLKPLPADLGRYRVRGQARVGGLINEYRLVA